MPYQNDKMYIYNITTNINEEIKFDWLYWMKETFIPAMLASRKFKKAIISQVLVEEEMGGVTYSTQYFAENKTIVDNFIQNDLTDILAEHTKFRGSYVDFSTGLQVISEIDGEV